MHRFFRWLNEKLHINYLYLKVTSSIAFFPSLIAVLIFMVGMICIYLDVSDLSYDITEHLPFFITRHPETARSILSTLTAGMFSLMVFSFSMVMVVLTVASNNYTPRVLPGLISTKRHQLVLGLYLGTISFLIITHINTDSVRYDFEVPVLSILLCVVLVLSSFAAFVAFIHGISQDIQIGNILDSLHRQARNQLRKENKNEFVEELPSSTDWAVIHSAKAGYFQGLDEETVLETARQQHAEMIVLYERGQFVIEGSPIIKCSKPLPEEDVRIVQEHCRYYHQERLSANYLYGFKHITEVAIKALSPGINDAGTALISIDYLTQLFLDLLVQGRHRVRRDRAGGIRLYFRESGFEEIFYLCFSSIRNYGAADVAVQQKLLRMLTHLEQHPAGKRFSHVFAEERKALLMNSEDALANRKDLTQLRKNIQKAEG
jgi:uncharacterized membrane protein